MKMITESDVIRLLPINRAIEVVEQAYIDYATDLITIGKRGTLVLCRVVKSSRLIKSDK